jgi:hypothetical protein
MRQFKIIPRSKMSNDVIKDKVLFEKYWPPEHDIRIHYLEF